MWVALKPTSKLNEVYKKGCC